MNINYTTESDIDWENSPKDLAENAKKFLEEKERILAHYVEAHGIPRKIGMAFSNQVTACCDVYFNKALEIQNG